MRIREEAFRTYWYFATERQNIFFRRLSGEIAPLTQDPILATYKFCNVYRACDRVSQFLIRDVIYSRTYPPKDTLFRIFLFRLLNKIETWQKLEDRLGEISLASFSQTRYSTLLTQFRADDGPIYGNAFILCATKAFGYDAKHDNHLALLGHVFRKTAIADQLLEAESLEKLFVRLKELPLIGDFMAYQLAIDFNYSDVFNFSENDFTVAGPGAIRGIRKCFRDTGRYSNTDVTNYMVENQDKEFLRYDLDFHRLGKRPLQAIDCQGLFCETDKYCRVRFPELASNRTRIKARFQQHRQPIEYFFPPKWHIVLPERSIGSSAKSARTEGATISS